MITRRATVCVRCSMSTIVKFLLQLFQTVDKTHSRCETNQLVSKFASQHNRVLNINVSIFRAHFSYTLEQSSSKSRFLFKQKLQLTL